jgi:hypothetical protein
VYTGTEIDRTLRTKQNCNYDVSDSDDEDMVEDPEEIHQDHLCTSTDPSRMGSGGETIILNSSELCQVITSQQTTDDQTVWMTTDHTGLSLTRDEDTQRPTSRYLHPSISTFITYLQVDLTSTSPYRSPTMVNTCTLGTRSTSTNDTPPDPDHGF